MDYVQVRHFCEFWFNSDFLTVGLFSFGGVGLRMVIGNTLYGSIESAATAHEGPYMEIFYTENYLACNILGCFVMGLCISFQKEISYVSPPMYKGITTGFCGSLTTLSSWMNGAVYKLFDQYWYKTIIMIVIQFWLTWAAFTSGIAMARLFTEMGRQWHILRCSVPQQHTNYINNISNISNSNVNAIEMIDKEALQPCNGDEDEEVMNSEVSPGAPIPDEQDEEEEPEEEYALKHDIYSIERGEKSQIKERKANRTVTNSAVIHTNKDAVEDPSKSIEVVVIPQCVRLIQSYEYYIWTVLFTSTALSVWIVLLLEPQLSYFNHILLRDTFRSVALAPCGAWLRWGLSRIPQIKELWPCMNPQTLLANVTAVLVMCVLLVFVDSSWVSAVNGGVQGSLSTVSTFIAEAHALYKENGAFISLRYAVVTVVSSIVIIQIIRGGGADL